MDGIYGVELMANCYFCNRKFKKAGIGWASRVVSRYIHPWLMRGYDSNFKGEVSKLNKQEFGVFICRSIKKCERPKDFEL